MLATSRTSKQKAAFRERHRDKLSEDIAASLSVIVEEGWEAYQTNEFGMDGNFLDKEDMDLKYKNKPEQLENIYKNARTITCPTRGVQLWEDPNWSSSAKNGSRTRQGVKRVITQNQDNCQKKTKKGSPGEEGGGRRVTPRHPPQGSHRRAAREDHEAAR